MRLSAISPRRSLWASPSQRRTRSADVTLESRREPGELVHLAHELLVQQQLGKLLVFRAQYLVQPLGQIGGRLRNVSAAVLVHMPIGRGRRRLEDQLVVDLGASTRQSEERGEALHDVGKGLRLLERLARHDQHRLRRTDLEPALHMVHMERQR